MSRAEQSNSKLFAHYTSSSTHVLETIYNFLKFPLDNNSSERIKRYTITVTMMRRASTLAPSAARGAVSATTRPFAPSIITPTASQSVQARRSYHANTLGSSNAARPSLGPRATYQPSQARRSYHEKVLDHYSNPRNVGSMSKTDTDVGTGLVGAPACGDVMKLQIRVNKADGKIDDVKFKYIFR